MDYPASHRRLVLGNLGQTRKWPSTGDSFQFFVAMDLLQSCAMAVDKRNWIPLNVTNPGKLHIALVEDIKSGKPYAITFQGYSNGCQYVEQLKPVPISAVVCGINDRSIEGKPLLQVTTMLRELPRPFTLYFRLQEGQAKVNISNKFMGFKAIREGLQTKVASTSANRVRNSAAYMNLDPNFQEDLDGAPNLPTKVLKKLKTWESRSSRQKRKRSEILRGTKGGGKLSETGVQVNPDVEDNIIGCFVDKYFRGYGWWTGVITEYSDPYYSVLYKDGSVETLTRNGLSKLLVYDDDVKVKKERDVYPGYILSGRCRANKEQPSERSALNRKTKHIASAANDTKLKATERPPKQNSCIKPTQDTKGVDNNAGSIRQKRKRSEALKGTKMVGKRSTTSLQVNPATSSGQVRKRSGTLRGTKEGGKLSETGVQVNPDVEDNIIGCFVDKYFRGYGWWTGVITEYSDPYYSVLYKDGSVETLTRNGLSKLLVYDDDVKVKKERDVYPGYILSGRCRANKEQPSERSALNRKTKHITGNVKVAEEASRNADVCMDWVPRLKIYLSTMSMLLKSILEEDLFCEVLFLDKEMVIDQNTLAQRIRLLSKADVFICDFSMKRHICFMEIGAALSKDIPVVFHGAYNSLSRVSRTDLELLLPHGWDAERHFTQTNITLEALDNIKKGLPVNTAPVEHDSLTMPNALMTFLEGHLLKYSDKVQFYLPTDKTWGVKFKIYGQFLVVKTVDEDRQDICKFRSGDVLYAVEGKVLINSQTSGGQIYDYLASLKQLMLRRGKKFIACEVLRRPLNK